MVPAAACDLHVALAGGDDEVNFAVVPVAACPCVSGSL